MLLGLAALVILLYRQLARAYDAPAVGRSGVVPGSQATDVEIMTDDGLGFFEFPSSDQPFLATFVSTNCVECHKLLKVLRRLRVDSLVVFSAGEQNPAFAAASSGLPLHSLGHPPDAERDYGIVIYPTTVVVRHRLVLGSTTGTSDAELTALFDEADHNWSELPPGGSTNGGSTVVTKV